MFVPVPGADGVLQVAQPIRTTHPLPRPEPAAARVGGDTEQVLAGLDLPPEVVGSARAWAAAHTNDLGGSHD
jgi:alpha-methylacyl-CoA racemase